MTWTNIIVLAGAAIAALIGLCLVRQGLSERWPEAIMVRWFGAYIVVIALAVALHEWGRHIQ